MRRSTILSGAALGALLLLAGCGQSLSRTFGLTRDAPDEFTVTTRAPLSMPPNFSLQPPQPGAPRPQEESTTEKAQVTIAGAAALTQPSGTDSPGQDALLNAAGPAPPANIRAVVNAEAAQAANNRPLSEELLFWKSPPPPGTVLDPQKEAERLRNDAALGRNPAGGEVPIIQKKNKSFLDTLF